MQSPYRSRQLAIQLDSSSPSRSPLEDESPSDTPDKTQRASCVQAEAPCGQDPARPAQPARPDAATSPVPLTSYFPPWGKNSPSLPQKVFSLGVWGGGVLLRSTFVSKLHSKDFGQNTLLRTQGCP